MANIKSQIKRNKQNEKRHERNKAVKSELKTRIKSALAKSDEAKKVGSDAVSSSLEDVKMALRRLDMAAQKGIIHKNQAANRKSKLVKAIAKKAAEIDE